MKSGGSIVVTVHRCVEEVFAGALEVVFFFERLEKAC